MSSSHSAIAVSTFCARYHAPALHENKPHVGFTQFFQTHLHRVNGTLDERQDSILPVIDRLLATIREAQLLLCEVPARRDEARVADG